MAKIQTELLKFLRKELNLKQDDVAEQIGVCRSQYANIEIGNTNPSIEVLINILQVFKISFEELYGLTQSVILLKIKRQKIVDLKKQIEELEKL
jgi:transcriptional regulator with XRE-family HTH domain